MKRFLVFLIVSLLARVTHGAPLLDEGFEGTTFPPPGWTTTSAGLPVPHSWHRTTDRDYRGTGRASAFVGSSSPSAIDEWLITPVVDLSASDKALKFSWSGSPQWSGVLDASLNIRETGAKEWTSLWSIRGKESPADPFIYRQRIVDLSTWAGRRVQFGFRVFGTNGASFGLDDIVIGDFAPAKFPVDVSCPVERARRSSPWQIVAVREPWAADVPFETRTHYLRPSPDRNYVPGPDSLVARVDTDAKGHPYILIERSGSGEIDTLFGGWASLPQWSPDGRNISCVAWKSRLNPYQLTVVDVSTKAVVIESDLAQTSESKWAPDSHAIAASGPACKWDGGFLYTITVPGGRVTVIDSLRVPASHEFSWSPDGWWIAFSRPTRVEHHGETIAADLWIADAATGESWCVLDAPEWAESDPLWITNRSIQVTRVRWNDEGENQEKRVVVELLHLADQRH